MNVREVFTIRLKKIREENGLSQTAAAKRIGWSVTRWNNYEVGVSIPECEALVQIADLFSVSTDYLLGRTDKRDINR